MQNSIEVSFDNLPLIVADMREKIYAILDFVSERNKEETPLPTTRPTQNWLSVKQVAKIIDRSQFTVYSMCNNDEIPFTRYRGRLQFDPIIIDEYRGLLKKI